MEPFDRHICDGNLIGFGVDEKWWPILLKNSSPSNLIHFYTFSLSLIICKPRQSKTFTCYLQTISRCLITAGFFLKYKAKKLKIILYSLDLHRRFFLCHTQNCQYFEIAMVCPKRDYSGEQLDKINVFLN